MKRKKLTDDIYIGVGEDGSMFVGGQALVDGSVSKDDLPEDQRRVCCHGSSGVLVSCC